MRDRETLRILYPGAPFLRMKVTSGGQAIGWAVALDTVMHDDQYFGNMRLGSLIDFLAPPEHAIVVCQTASFYANYDSASGPSGMPCAA